MRSTALALVVVVVVVGCGGKIAEEPGEGPDTRSGTGTGTGGGSEGTAFVVPAPSSAPSVPPPSYPSKPTVEDACRTICERNGQCGALQGDCYERCTGDIHGASGCASEANAYIHCYANNLEGCAALPPVCENAYCAFTRCAGGVVPEYCH
jgi:hypothetical protein